MNKERKSNRLTDRLMTNIEETEGKEERVKERVMQ